MEEKLTTLCSIEDFIPFLNIILTEEQLNGSIHNYGDMVVLHISLKVKYYYILHGQQERIAFPLKSIFKQITRTNLQNVCDVLELSVLVQNIESATLSFYECLSEFYKTENDVYIILMLLNVITNIYSHLKLTLPSYFNENLIQNLYLQVFNTHSKSLQNLFCRLLLKYVTCTTNINNLLYCILSLDDLYTISCCFDIFIRHKHLISEKFWLMVIDNLNNSCGYSRKLSLNILKNYIRSVGEYCQFCEELDMIKGGTESNRQFLKCWHDYFLLMEMSQEKALHLIAPALTLILNVSTLHHSWLICLYRALLSHPQNAVVYSVTHRILKTNLSDNIEVFRNIIQCVLPVLNKCEYAENYLTIWKQFKELVSTIRDDYFHIALKESLKVTWSPVPAWYFYSSVIANRNKSTDVSLIICIISHIKSLPHLFIKRNCYLILLDLLVKQKKFSNLSLNEFINIAVEIKKIDENLLLLFYQYSHDNIQLYNKHTDMEISRIIQHSLLDEVEVFMQIINYDKQELRLLEDILLSGFVNYEVEQCLILYLVEHLQQFDVVRYLKHQLQAVSSDKDVDALCDIVDCVELSNLESHLALIQECKLLLLNPTQFQETNIILAFKVYNKNVDEDIDSIVKTWNDKLLNGDKIQSKICKFYIYVYFRYLKTSNKFIKAYHETYKIITLIFDTQPEEIWLNIYENVDILLQYNDEVILILERLFNELNAFANTGNLIKAWSFLIKEVLHNTNLFVVENVKALVTNKIPQFCLINDMTAYIFVNELLSVPKTYNILFINLIVDLVFYGGTIRKDKRCEYHACKDIESVLNTESRNNPNYIHVNVRCIAINVILRILNDNREDVANMICDLCLERYRQHFKKRYFPDSEIHLSKLRAGQILFILLPYISNDYKTKLIDIIFESLCQESHQPSVKQLMQWLLVMLLVNKPEHLEKIFKMIDRTECSHMSTIVAFIPVLYHVCSKSNEEFIENLIQVLLRWTMGAHFRLRLYSQVVIIKLIEMCVRRKLMQIVYKYDMLYKVIKIVLEMTGSSVESTLQTDKVFLDQFSEEKGYDFHLIYKAIPQLNGVIETEWEYIDFELLSYNQSIPINGYLIKVENAIRKSFPVPDGTLVDMPVSNMQKKILPSEDLKIADNDQVKRHGTELILIATLIDSSANLGGVARTCEIYGVKELIVSDRKIITEKEFKSLSMSSEHWVNITEVKRSDLEKYLLEIKRNGYIVVGVEQTPESFKLHNYTIPKKCALVLGNEKEGIPSHIFPFLDVCVEIPQFGLLRSLNVHVAGAIVVWEYVKQNIL